MVSLESGEKESLLLGNFVNNIFLLPKLFFLYHASLPLYEKEKYM